jgi:hypothetical protein
MWGGGGGREGRRLRLSLYGMVHWLLAAIRMEGAGKGTCRDFCQYKSGCQALGYCLKSGCQGLIRLLGLERMVTVSHELQRV